MTLFFLRNSLASAMSCNRELILKCSWRFYELNRINYKYLEVYISKSIKKNCMHVAINFFYKNAIKLQVRYR